MITRRWSFSTKWEVWAFIQGIEFAAVRDLTVERDKNDPVIVYTMDRSEDRKDDGDD